MQTIIITTDFSEPSLNAAKYAAALSGPLQIERMVLYHSYDNSPVVTEIPLTEPDTSSAHEQSLQGLEALEKEVRLSLGMNTAVSIELITNDMPLLLGVEQLAEQRRASMVVVGATGKSNLEQVLVGSNTINLASESKVPLLIVPKKARFSPIDKIVFACDLKRVSRSTPVSIIGQWLKYLEAKLLVLNVALEGKRFNPDMISEQYKIHDLLDEFHPEYHYTEGDDIVDEIQDFAEDHLAGLIITIPKAYGFFEGLFHRSVSKQLIKESEIPLLLLRERAE
ncbi:hypothetical protein GCM10023231_21150 [Olivibacter ginsenosidimutans]|uniref:UspA domain-containing protein n=1 Tax=Olivibacter ginsenosidimutans TaxID=1176537 RepID=A0ABP9BB02_9SPHI